jgi:Na+/H+ antiporter NhaD/arsenite permease-like protein
MTTPQGQGGKYDRRPPEEPPHITSVAHDEHGGADGGGGVPSGGPEDRAHGHGHGRGFAGPKCWIVSVIAGVLAGLLVAMLAPAKPAAAEGGADHGAAPTVVQFSADGSKVERLPDGSTRPVGGGTVPVEHGADSGAAAPGGHGGAGGGHGAEPAVPLWLCAPFAALLLSIAVMPFVSAHVWHRHYPDFAFFLGSAVLAYYLAAMGEYGRHAMLHTGLEYYSFIALVGGLYVASGGILVDIRDRATPLGNVAILGAGAVLANLLGTTGASVLLIRPFLRVNRCRLRPLHVVFFIFIVSNCGGCLTPIGDPPLYLGYLKGVPFFWTLTHMWPMWLMVNGLLLGMFYVYDRRLPLAPVQPGHGPVDVAGKIDRAALAASGPAIVCLLLLVAGVFVDPLVRSAMPGSALAALPLGATFQVVMAVLAYALARPSIRHANQFTFEPVKEVGFLFVGIFLTMAPALGYLGTHAAGLGLETPTQYYFFTGGLSAVLDNAPTYLSFLQVALGTLHVPLDAEGIRQFIGAEYELTHHLAGAGGAAGAAGGAGEAIHFSGVKLLEGISLGAVFFGAMTYIGNGPNFMVKSIVDAAYASGRAPGAAPGQADLGTAMPSFFGYVGYSFMILLPVLVLNWLVFIR